jgi:hypothetical protein
LECLAHFSFIAALRYERKSRRGKIDDPRLVPRGAPTVQYFVVFHHVLSTLIDEVNRKIAEGWRPIGGVTSQTLRDGNTYFYQAMQFVE